MPANWRDLPSEDQCRCHLSHQPPMRNCIAPSRWAGNLASVVASLCPRRGRDQRWLTALRGLDGVADPSGPGLKESLGGGRVTAVETKAPTEVRKFPLTTLIAMAAVRRGPGHVLHRVPGLRRGPGLPAAVVHHLRPRHGLVRHVEAEQNRRAFSRPSWSSA